MTTCLTSFRRAAIVFAAFALMAAALLIMGSHNSAQAAPAYPPVQPSQTHRVPSHGVKAIESHRAAPSAPAKQHSTNSDSSLSETGFATLTATTVAIALFAGGAIFLGLGRRRRHI